MIGFVIGADTNGRFGSVRVVRAAEDNKMININRHGITRTVILTNRYAIKFPTMRYGWSKFLIGLLSNMDEVRFTCLADHFKLCPTLFNVPGGWMNVQPRCQPLTDDEWSTIEHLWEPGASNWCGISCDFKRDNFGTLNGVIVLLDYGQLT